MTETGKTKVSIPLVMMVLIAALLFSSCNPKATHFTQNLEYSRVPGQQSTQTPAVNASTHEQETAPAQAPTSVKESTATKVNPQSTQYVSATSTVAQVSPSASMVLTPTATKKSTTPQPATATLTPTQTRTSTPTLTATATPTKTATFTLTPTLQTGWEGEWIIFIQLANGTYTSGTMILALNGTDVIATAILDGVEYNFEGDIYAEGKQITGPWQTDSNSGYFWWQLVSDAQFGGSQDLQYGICGARAGAEKPDPCFIDPPS